MQLKIIDVFWTPTVNMANIQCGCGNIFGHPLNRWVVSCPRCGARNKIDFLRNEFAIRSKK